MNSNFISYNHEFSMVWDIMSMNSNFTMLIRVFIEVWTCTACISEPEAFLGIKKRRNSWKICNGSCYIILLLETRFVPTL